MNIFLGKRLQDYINSFDLGLGLKILINIHI